MKFLGDKYFEVARHWKEYFHPENVSYTSVRIKENVEVFANNVLHMFSKYTG